MRQREHGRDFFLIVDGSVRIEYNGQAVAQLGNGDFIGEMSLLDGQPRSATVVTETPTLCLVISGRSFDDLVDSMPSLGRRMLAILSRRIRDLEERFVLVPGRADRPGPSGPDESESAATVPLIDGVLCTRNHFNNPAAAYCGICGVSMLQGSRQRVKGPRPPLGMLIADDGTFYVLDGDYVIGSSVQDDERVQSGEARPIALSDEEGSAPQRADIVLHDWGVFLRNRDAKIALSRPDTSETSPVGSGETVELPVGSTVTLGNRTLRLESNLLHI
jgi:hypothetical protein